MTILNIQFAPDIQLQHRLSKWGTRLAALVILIAVIIFTGWLLDIDYFRHPISRLPAMNPTTAVMFMLLGAAFLLCNGNLSGQKNVLLKALLVLLVMISVTRLLPLLIRDFNFQVDLFFLSEKLETVTQNQAVSRMAYSTAACFLLTGVSLLIYHFKKGSGKVTAQYIALGICFVSILSLLGYSYQVSSFYTMLAHLPMTVYSAFCFLLISLSLLFATSDKGFMKDFTSTYTGSYTARRIIPVLILVPGFFGLLRLYGYRAGWYSNEFGVAILIISVMLVFLLLTWYNTVLLNKRDALKEQSEKALLESREQVQAIFKGAPDAIIVIDESGNIVQWNHESEKLFGWQAREVIGKPLADLVIPDQFREAHRKGLHRYIKTGETTIMGKTLELRGLKKNNTEVEIALRIAPAMLENQYLFIGFIRDISVEKKMQEKIRKFNEDLEQQVKEKTAQLTAIFERISDGFIALDKNFCYTYVNRKTGELIRRDPQTLVGKNVWELFPDAVGSGTYKAFKKAMEEQVYVSNTDYYPPLDLWQENHIYPSPDGLSVFIRDITERKKTELALKESEEKYRILFERSPLPMWVYEIESLRIISVNDAMIEHYGYSKEEFLQMTVLDIRPPSEHEKFHEHFSQSGSGLRHAGVWKHIRKDGTVIDMEIRSHDIAFDHKKCRLVLGNDVTEKLKFQKELAESENRLRTIVQTEPECVKLLGATCELLEMNPAGLAMLEAEDPGQVLGKSVVELVIPEYRNAFVNLVSDVFKGKSRTLEFEITGLKGSRRWLELHAVPMKNTKGEITSLLGVTRDVTERKKYEDQIKHTTEELRRLTAFLQRVREEERISIAREIHDELGQQLTVLKMDISQLKKKLLPDDDILMEKVNNLLATVDSTVKTVRRISSDLRPGMLDDLGLEAAMEWHAQEFERRSGIKTHLNTETGNVPLSAEIATGLYRIFQECLTNVARHAEATEVRISLQMKDSDLLMSINDNGKGFIQSEIENKKTLGILGMRERALMMGGEYVIESTPGKGSVTRIRVPVSSRN